MFEKEAEEYFNKTYNDIMIRNRNTVTKAFQDGAEFGYNKANEWHYVKDGDLPKENMKQVMVVTNHSDCLMGWYSYPRNTWWSSECPDPDDRIEFDDIKVIMWKEIVLPKESE